MDLLKRQLDSVSKKSVLVLILFLVLTGWWILNITIFKGDGFLLEFSLVYGVISVFGGIFGVGISKKWGLKSLIGKAIFVFSLGLFAQEFGQLSYGYYNAIKNIAIPYPSIGDLGYFGSVLLYIYGAILLAKASGVKFRLSSFLRTLQSILIPTGILIFAVLFFLRDYQFDWSDPLKIFLDFAYPFGQAIYLSIVILTYILSKKSLGGFLKNKILFILGALFFQFICDYTFLYQASHETWYPGGINDLMYLISYFLMTMALLQLSNESLKKILLPKIKSENRTLPMQVEDTYANLALKIITEEEKIIGKSAWDLAFTVNGVTVGTDFTLRLVGNKNQVINELISQYEKVLGQSSRELAKDATKALFNLVDALVIETTIGLNLSSAFFFVRQTRTETFESIFPHTPESKLQMSRESFIVRHLKDQKAIIVKGEISEQMKRSNSSEEAKELNAINHEMESFKAEVASGFFSDGDLIGILLLGPKNNNQLFSSNDLAMISKLTRETARELALIMHYKDTRASIFLGAAEQ